MCSKPERGKKCFQSLVDNLTQLARVTPKDGGIIYAEYKSYVEDVPKNRQLFLNFSKHLGRLYEFLFSNVWGLDDCPYLKRVTKMILVLIHGQAFVQKGFNVNKNLLQSNLEGLPLTSQRLIYDHLVSIDLTPESIAISKELRDSVRKAGSRQRIEYEDRKERSVWCKKAKSRCDSK